METSVILVVALGVIALFVLGIWLLRSLRLKRPTADTFVVPQPNADRSDMLPEKGAEPPVKQQRSTTTYETAQVFVSYAREDKTFAQKLSADLDRSGVPAWIDELGIHGGEDWPARIAVAIQSCTVLLVVLSPQAVASRWVRRELEYADTRGKQILPVVYRATVLPDTFELRFGNVQRVDFTRGSYESNFDQLLASVKAQLGSGQE